MKNYVSVPPRWLVEPVDVSVERKRNVALHCQAQGVPTPTVTWKKATGLLINLEQVQKNYYLLTQCIETASILYIIHYTSY